MPEDMRLFIKRVPDDAERVLELENQVVFFLDELDRKLVQLVAATSRREAA
jgi:hypothetical protein